MAHIINPHPWVLPTVVIEKASLEATKMKLNTVYLSKGAKKDSNDFLFFADEEQKNMAFIIDSE